MAIVAGGLLRERKGWLMRSQTLPERPPHPKRPDRQIVAARVTPNRAPGGLPRAEADEPPRPAASRKRPTTRDTARVLLRAYHEHGDLAARERLIQQYMPLVKSLARRHSMGGELYEDLVQVGCIGLIKAVDRFDPGRAEFGAFVIPNVAGEIKRYLRDRAWPVRVPRRLQELRPGLRACSAELSAQLARPATVSEIADRSGIAEQEVVAALDTERIQSPLSLSDAASQDDESYCDARRPRGRLRARRAAGAPRRWLPRTRRARASPAAPALLRRAEPAPDREGDRDLADPRLAPDAPCAVEAPSRDRPDAEPCRRPRGRRELTRPDSRASSPVRGCVIQLSPGETADAPRSRSGTSGAGHRARRRSR